MHLTQTTSLLHSVYIFITSSPNRIKHCNETALNANKFYTEV